MNYEKRQKTQITKIRNKSGAITTDYRNKKDYEILNNPDEMDKILETQNLPTPYHKEEKSQ